MSRLVVTNAIYFLGSWEHEFIENATKDAPFWTAPNEQHSIPMMRQTANFSYGEFDDLQVLEMPYRSASPELRPLQDKERLMQAAEIPDGGSELAMTIVLPRKIDGLKEVEARLSPSTLQTKMPLQSCQVEAQIPKFRIESSFLLSESLHSMGIRRAFSMEDADRAIEHEVPGPHVVWVLGSAPVAAPFATAQTPLFPLFPRHLKALLLPQSKHSFAIHPPAFAPQNGHHETITVPRTLAHQLVQSRNQPSLLFVCLRDITLRATRLPQHRTCPTLAHQQSQLHLQHRLPSPRRAQ